MRSWMLEKNRVMNLTAITRSASEIAAKHYLDSWRVTRHRCRSDRPRRMLDLGTGAGFPGLPIALAEPKASLVTLCRLDQEARSTSSSECVDEALS